MPVLVETDKCWDCGAETLVREIWLSTQDFREECLNCRLFREASYGYRIAAGLGLEHDDELTVLDPVPLLAAMQQLHFHGTTVPCLRVGTLKDEEAPERHTFVDTVFQSPTDVPETQVDWHSVNSTHIPTWSDNECEAVKICIAMFWEEVFPRHQIVQIIAHERFSFGEEEKSPVGIMISSTTIDKLIAEDGFNQHWSACQQFLSESFERTFYLIPRAAQMT